MKSKVRVLCVLSCLFATGGFSQVVFERTYSFIHKPEMYFIQPLSGGGYIISGRCSSQTDNTLDFCFLKTDEFGNVIWSRQFADNTLSPGTPMNEWATTVRESSDGSYIFGGCVDDPGYNYGGAFYGWMDSSGVLLNSLIKTTTWSTSVNAMLINHAGKIVSTRDDSQGAGHHTNRLEVISTAGQYLSGNSSGNFSLAKQALVMMPDGGYGSIGIDEFNYNDPLYNSLPIVSRFDSNANLLWNFRIHKEVYSGDTLFNALCPTPGNGLLICGYTKTGINKIILTQFNSAGDSLWTKAIGGPQNLIPEAIQLTNDGGFAITGTINEDVFLLKLSAAGDSTWLKSFGGSNIDNAIYFQQTTDDGYIILASTENSGRDDIYLIKTDGNGNSSSTITKTGKADPADEFIIYPDPFSSSINVSITGKRDCVFSLRDLTGRLIFSKEISGGKDHLDLSFLPSGIYYASVTGDVFLKSQMLVKQ